ncbi:hypothetical protein BGZ74_001710 [Mortierella antarctica]|nr:hypothetical protein BGZ74_001710 [Mortierella antarctica]
MDWSPSLSVDYYNHPNPYSSTDNTPTDNDGASDSTTMLDFCYPSRDYGDSSERIANMTLIKLQRASAGRQQCLLRQVQLTRMLHRIRFQAFLRPVLGYDPSGAFDQDLSSPPTLDTSEPHPPLDTIRYEWDQESLGPNQLASALSLDMLLSMGSPSTAAPSSDLSSCPDSSSSSLSSDQGMFSLVPLVSFANEFLDPSSRQQDLSSIPSSVPSTVSSPMAPPSHHQQQPLTPSYYELLMANPNEPLSQLMSTNATSITSSSFTATCSSMDHLSTFSISTPTPTPTPTLTATATATPTASSSSPTETHGSTSIPCSDQQMLTSTSSPFQLTAYPIDHPGAPSSDASRPTPQTVPLTTKEIMDALSGQLPIQPLTPTEMPFPVSEPLPSATTVITTTSTSTPSYDSTSPYTQGSGTMENSSWKGDRDMLSPPPHFQEVDERTESSESVAAKPSSETTSEEMDVDEANVAMTSPPSSPPAAMGRSPRQRSSSRPSTRRSTRGNRSGSLGIPDTSAPEPSTTGERGRKARSRSPKRRRMSEEDVSYCSESSPESCPASPKTPPPMDHHAEESFQQELGLDHDLGCEDGHPKRRRSDATEEAGLMSVVEIVGKVVVQESIVQGLKTGSGAQEREALVRDAGRLSPAPTPLSPSSRYPKRRQSTRILGRGTACSTSVGDGLVGANKVSAA